VNVALIFLAFGCIGFGMAADSAAALIFGWCNFLLALGSLELRDWRRNRAASHDLSALGRDDDRLGWEHNRRAS
jgi:hypothetical protein